MVIFFSNVSMINKSLALVIQARMNSSLALLHASTSISFAVLFNKPTVF